jgi:O-antigen/teichoic acid export membrane protein
LLWRGVAILLAANMLFVVIVLRFGGYVARHFYHSPALVRYLPLFAGLMLLGVISGFYGKVLVGYKLVGTRTVITSFIVSPFMMLFAVALVRRHYGLSGYLMAQAGASLLASILLFLAVRKYTPLEARRVRPWPDSLARDVWSFSAAGLLSGLLEFLIVQLDRIALGFYLNPRTVGIYAVAAAMVTYETLILTSVNQVFSPIIADLHAKGDSAMLGRLYKGLTKWVLGMTLPLAIAVMTLARPLMRIFGPEFEVGWPILVIGTAGQLVNCGVGSAGLLLWMSGNQRRFLTVEAAMAAAVAVLNGVLVPTWGMIGAAFAAALANAGTNALNLMAVRKALKLSPFSPGFARLLTPTVASALAAVALKRTLTGVVPDWMMIGGVLLATYGVFAGVAALGGLDADDRLIGGAIWSRVLRSAKG